MNYKKDRYPYDRDCLSRDNRLIQSLLGNGIYHIARYFLTKQSLHHTSLYVLPTLLINLLGSRSIFSIIRMRVLTTNHITTGSSR